MTASFDRQADSAVQASMSHETHVAPRRGLTPDPARFFIPVDLDRRRVLCFDNRAAFRIYQRYGAAFWRELFESDPENGGQLRLRSQDAFEFFLCAGLQRDAEEAGEELSLATVQENIFPSTIGELVSALVLALSATRVRPEKQRGNAPGGAAGAPVAEN